MHTKLTLGTLVAALAFVPALAFAAPAAPPATSSPAATSTQQTGAPTIAAEVNIYNAKITNTSGRSYTINFDLENGVGVENNVKYGVFLQAGTASTSTYVSGNFSDLKVYPMTFTLPQNSSQNETITYTAPSSLSGKYTLYLFSRNEAGLPLAVVPVGTITLPTATSGIYLDPTSCYVTIPNSASSTKYALLEGIDMYPSEGLNVTCTAQNESNAQVSVQPVFKTYARSPFGSEVTTGGVNQSVITFAPREKKQLTLPVPLSTKPQAYDSILSLQNNYTAVSNRMDVHYVVDGSSATLQSLSISGGPFVQNGTAHVKFSWSGSASDFPGARHPGAPGPVAYKLAIVNRSGASCLASSEETTTSLFSNGSPAVSGTVTKDVLLSKNCTMPQLTVDLLSGQGTVLASSSVTALPPVGATGSQGLWGIILLVVGLLGVLIVAGWLWRRRKQTQKIDFSHGTITPLLLLAIVGFASVSFFAVAPTAHADTFSVSGWHDTHGWGPPYGNYTHDPQIYTFTVNLNSNHFTPGASVQANGYITTTICGNEVYYNNQTDWASLSARSNWNGQVKNVTNGNPYAYADHSGVGSFGATPRGTAYFNAPSPGGQSITYIGTGKTRSGYSTYTTWNSGSCSGTWIFGTCIVPTIDTQTNTHTMGFQVCGSNQYWNGSSCVNNTPPSPPSISFSQTQSQTTSGGAFTLNWSASNASSCSMTKTKPTNSTATWPGPISTTGNAADTPTLIGTFTYTLTCSGPGGSASASVQHKVVNPTPSCGPNQYVNGANMCACKAGYVSINGGASCVPQVSCTAPHQYYVSSNNTCACNAGYSHQVSGVACSPNCGANAQLNSNGNACVCKPGGFVPSGANSCACPQYTSKVGSVCQDNAPSVSFSASPTQVYRGGSSTVTWSTDPAVTPAAQTSCAPSAGSTGFSTGNKPNGTYKLTNLTSTTNLSITCTYKGQSNTANTTITVLQPSMTLTTTPDKVNSSGGTSNVSWNASNVTSCSLTKNGQNWAPSGAVLTPPKGSHAISGSASVTVTSNTTVTLTCNGSSVTKTIDVAGKYSNF